MTSTEQNQSADSDAEATHTEPQSGKPSATDSETIGGDKTTATVEVQHSHLDNSPINLAVGEKAPKAVSEGTIDPLQIGELLTKMQTVIRRLNREWLELQAQHQASTDLAEKTRVVGKMKDERETLQVILPIYVQQTKSVGWVIPTDIQEVIARVGFS